MNTVQFLLLGITCGTIAYTITRGSIFIELRDKIIDYSIWWGKLFTCPYCMSHWVTAFAMFLFHPKMLESSLTPADYIATWFALAGISAFFAGSIQRVYYKPEG